MLWCWWSTLSHFPLCQRMMVYPSFQFPDPCIVLSSPSFACSSQVPPLRIDINVCLVVVILEAMSWYLGAKAVSLKLLATLGNCQQAQQMVKDWLSGGKQTNPSSLDTEELDGWLFLFHLQMPWPSGQIDMYALILKASDTADSSRDPGITSLKAKAWLEVFLPNSMLQY